MNAAPRRDAAVLVFFLCVFALFSSGRLASSDAGEQLRVSMLLATAGAAGMEAATARASWVAGPNGRRYEPHDIGNAILMLPAAWIGSHLSRTATPVDEPPPIARAIASLTCACLAALAGLWVFQVAALFAPARIAFLVALAFPLTTIFLAYARAAWDVLGACVFMCGALYYSMRLLRGTAPSRSVVLLALTLAAACSFRYSLAPFVVPAAAWIAWTARRVLAARHVAIAAALFAALMTPSFVYNFVRTGSPLRPGTTTDVYLAGPNALTGSVAHGLYGLLISPNRGLFLYSPVLLVVAGLPFAWRRLSAEQRHLIGAYGLASIGYILLISRMASWGAFGWGPRYLLPIVPVLFIAAAFVALHARGVARACVIALAILSAVLTLPSMLVNWHLATTTWVEAVNPDAPRPLQQIAAWRALAIGLRGQTLDDGGQRTEGGGQRAEDVFPDWLLVRVAHQSRAGAVAAAIAWTLGIGIAAACARRVMVDG